LVIALRIASLCGRTYLFLLAKPEMAGQVPRHAVAILD
jgi:hypothetical protein